MQHGVDVGCRQGESSISETTTIIGFSCRVCRGWCYKKITSRNEYDYSYYSKDTVSVTGWKTMARLVKAKRKVKRAKMSFEKEVVPRKASLNSTAIEVVLES